MYIVTNGQMREADAYTIEKLGVPSLELMERAGVALAKLCVELAPIGKILCLCGGGNNGGDGFVCARHLQERGRSVEVVCFAEKYSQDCQENKKKWVELGGEVLTEIPRYTEYTLVVDCLFGTGLKGGLTGKNAEAVLAVNGMKERGTFVLSADIPSGINGENGLVESVAVQADVTLCIGEIKLGCTFGDGLDYAGEIQCEDIGIALPRGKDEYAKLQGKQEMKKLLPKRKRNSHKGSYGRAAIVGGSKEYTGAAYLSAVACLHAGAGYTTLFVPENILPYYVLKAPELLLKSISEGDRYAFNSEKMKTLLTYDAIAYGMGMGESEAVARGASYLLRRYEGKLILDADGLNSLAKYQKDELPALFKNAKCQVLLTPHVKEFSRLSGMEVKGIIEGGILPPITFAAQNQISVLLKGAASVLTDGARVFINATGNSGLAKGGSGDVLSGVIVGLCAMGLSAFDGGRLGAYLVGRAAELAASYVGEYALTATKVIDGLGMAFLELTDD